MTRSQMAFIRGVLGQAVMILNAAVKSRSRS
jgi:hypothetical protein